MRLFITRHGETVENTQHVIQGHLPGTLTEEGKREARLLAERLKDEGVKVIYSSDLARAMDTANIIGSILHVPVIPLKELREADFGSFTGMHSYEVDWKSRPDEIESDSSIRSRVGSVLDMIARGPHQTVLVVAHEGSVKSAIGILRESDESIPRLQNTSLSVYDLFEGYSHELVFNDVSHIK